MSDNGPEGRIPEEFKRSSVPHKVSRRSLAENEDEELDEDEQQEEEEEHKHSNDLTKRHQVVVARPDIVYHQPAEIVHRAPVVVHRPDVVIHRAPVIVHRPSVVVHKPDVVLHQPPVIFNTPNPMVHQPHAVSHDMYVTRPVAQYHGSELQHVGGMMATPAITGHVTNTGHSVTYENDCEDGDDSCSNNNHNSRVFGEQEFDFPVTGNQVPFGAGMGLNGGVDGEVNSRFAAGAGRFGQAGAGGYGGYGAAGYGAAGYAENGGINGNAGFAGNARFDENAGFAGNAGVGYAGGVGNSFINNAGLAAGNNGFAGAGGVATTDAVDAAGPINGADDTTGFATREDVPAEGETADEGAEQEQRDENAQVKSKVEKPHKKSFFRKRDKHIKATKKQMLGGGHIGIGLGGAG